MENRTINLAVVAEVAQALQELNNQIVFVGGAVVSLYTNDTAADEIRPTADIDMTVVLANLQKWPAIEERLRELGFSPDPFGHAMCRYKYQNIPVDIMPPEDTAMGPSNPWYKQGFEDLQTVTVHGIDINILSAPFYLATKFEAYNSRGEESRFSHDMEDIIYVIDNRKEIVEEIKLAPRSVQEFIKSGLQKLIDTDLLDAVLEVAVHPLVAEFRIPIIKEKIYQILT